MTGPPVDVLVLDVDDTLYLERDYVRSGFTFVAATHELLTPRFADEAWRLFEDGARGDIFDRALEAVGVPATRDLVLDLVSIYRHHRPMIELTPDSQRLIDDARAAAKPIAVITDGPPPSQAAKVEALGLASHAHTIVITGQRDGWSKPAAAAFEHVARATGCAHERLVYVADNPAKDFSAPSLLGWRTVRIRRPGGLHHSVPTGADVDLEVATLDDVPRSLWGST